MVGTRPDGYSLSGDGALWSLGLIHFIWSCVTFWILIYLYILLWYRYFKFHCFLSHMQFCWHVDLHRIFINHSANLFVCDWLMFFWVIKWHFPLFIFLYLYQNWSEWLLWKRLGWPIFTSYKTLNSFNIFMIAEFWKEILVVCKKILSREQNHTFILLGRSYPQFEVNP